MLTISSSRRRLAGAVLAMAFSASALTGPNAFADGPFIPQLVNTSTIPANGDVNPYGVAFVPPGFPSGGSIKAGDVLVSNFNDVNNVQGNGTTIISFSPGGPLAPPGSATTFFSSALPGLSTALGVLRGGFVIVGNVPTTNGAVPVFQGALQVIDRHGHWVQTLTSAEFLNGPWDLAIDDDGPTAQIYVSNVAIGTVTRLDVTVGSERLTVNKMTTLATGYTVEANAGAVILGPTGLALDEGSDTLFVASTADNAIYAIPNADHASSAVHRGVLVFADPHLRGPLALKFAPNGDLLTANGDAVNVDPEHPSEIVEFTRFGQFVAEYDVDASEGGAFGIDTVLFGNTTASGPSNAGPNFAVVDDVTSNLAVYRLPVP